MPIYIRNGDVQYLKPRLNRQHNFAGPVVGNLSFNEIDGFTTHFNHEPFFEYEFTPGLLKMRSINSKEYPRYLKQYQQEHNLADMVLTKDSLHRQWGKLPEYKTLFNCEIPVSAFYYCRDMENWYIAL